MITWVNMNSAHLTLLAWSTRLLIIIIFMVVTPPLNPGGCQFSNYIYIFFFFFLKKMVASEHLIKMWNRTNYLHSEAEHRWFLSNNWGAEHEFLWRMYLVIKWSRQQEKLLVLKRFRGHRGRLGYLKEKAPNKEN